MGLELFMEAFWELTTCRSLSMAEGPIPWTAIRSYCDELELWGEQRDDMFFHIRALDNEYLKHRNAKRAPKKDGPPARKVLRRKEK